MKEAVLIEENENLIRLKSCDFNTIKEEQDYIIKNDESIDEDLKKKYEALDKKLDCIIL